MQLEVGSPANKCARVEESHELSSELVARGVRLATIHWPCQGNNHGQDHMGRRPKNARLIFVSHSGQDTWVARQIANGISAAGARPFLDEADVNVGADFEE